MDEADEMLKLGFQEDIEKIFEFVSKHGPKKTQNMLFSATIPSWVSEVSRKYLSSGKNTVTQIANLSTSSSPLT